MSKRPSIHGQIIKILLTLDSDIVWPIFVKRKYKKADTNLRVYDNKNKTGLYHSSVKGSSRSVPHNNFWVEPVPTRLTMAPRVILA